MRKEVLRPGPAGRTLTHDLSTGRVELVYDWQVGGLIRLPNGLEVEDRNRTVFSIVGGRPAVGARPLRDGRVDRPRRVADAVRDASRR